MDDLISRQAAIDAICSVCGNDCDKAEFVYNAPQDEQVILCSEHYCLCILPPAQTEQQWIPCKLLDHYYIKELKDCDNKSYLVTYKTKTGRRYVKKVNIYHGKIQSKVGGKVIAWMPLPDAYEEDD